MRRVASRKKIKKIASKKKAAVLSTAFLDF
jgi:hypothetical protein